MRRERTDDEQRADTRRERLDRARQQADAGEAKLPRIDPCEARELLRRLRAARQLV